MRGRWEHTCAVGLDDHYVLCWGGKKKKALAPPPALVLLLSVSLLYSLSAAVARARGWTPRTGLCWGGKKKKVRPPARLDQAVG